MYRATQCEMDKCQGNCNSDEQCAAGLKCWQRDGLVRVPGCLTGGIGDVWGQNYCAPCNSAGAAATEAVCVVGRYDGSTEDEEIVAGWRDRCVFSAPQTAIIAGKALSQVTRISLGNCRAGCDADPRCRSLQYRSSTGTCVYNDSRYINLVRMFYCFLFCIAFITTLGQG